MLTEGRRRQLRVLLAIVLDTGMIAAAFAFAYLLRFYWQIIPALDEPPPGPYFLILPPALVVWILIFAAHGLYRERTRPFFDEALTVTSAISAGMMVVLAGSFFYREFSYSRLWMLLAWGLSVALVLAARGTLRAGLRIARAAGIDVRHVLVVGAGPEGQALVHGLRRHPELGLRPVAFLDAGATGPIEGLPVAGPPLEVLRVVRQVGAHRVLIAQPAQAREETMRVAALCQEAGVSYAVLPDLYALLTVGADVEFVAGLPLLVPPGAPLGGWGSRVKDALDVLGAAVGLILTFPMFMVISAFVALDSPGPLFYGHKRIGKGGVPFAAWKFRTMRVNGEEEPGFHPDLEARFREAYKLKDDPRVTRVGRWLRRTSLDELPQLLNVLKGEMSLVGPRPIVEEELSKYGPWERRLLYVKPGLTGLWQVFRHDEPDYENRVSLDMYYIDNWSLGLDLKILIRTLPAVLSGRGAY